MTRNKSKEFTVENYQGLALAMTAASRIPAIAHYSNSRVGCDKSVGAF